MTKIVLIAGCRNYTNYEEAKEFIDSVLKKVCAGHRIVIISGGCRGADALGERYATENDIPFEIYPAEWNKYGRAAGPKRNRNMADRCDIIICFWDGISKGTKSLIKYAEQKEKAAYIKHIQKPSAFH